MKNIIIAIIFSILLIVFAFVFTNNKDGNINQNKKNETPVNNVSFVDGKQIIEIKAKGGYTPKKSIAKADIPTILRINTKGTFDCSSSIRIPSMNFFKNLPQSGVTDIDLGVNNTGTLQGSCGMGMYPFEIDFK